MRRPLSAGQEEARVWGLRTFQHPNGALVSLARDVDCLPVFIDWTAFYGLQAGGLCVRVDTEDEPGRVEPVCDLPELILLVGHACRVPGLEGLEPPRPPSRPPCPHCQGAGSIRVESLGRSLGCLCGGLGWLPLGTEELGLVNDA